MAWRLRAVRVWSAPEPVGSVTPPGYWTVQSAVVLEYWTVQFYRGGLMDKPKVLMDGLGIPESPRWHGGRLWFCNWIAQEIVAVAPDGTSEAFPVPEQGQLM